MLDVFKTPKTTIECRSADSPILKSEAKLSVGGASGRSSPYSPPSPSAIVFGRRLTAIYRPDTLFFGENYRCCCDLIHIVNAGYTVAILDGLKLIIELAFFSSLVGYFDTFHVAHLTWALVAFVAAGFGFWQERFFLFWPILALKATKMSFTLISMIIILCFSLVYRPWLYRLIKWAYPRVEHPISFGIGLSILLLVILAIDAIVFDVIYRLQTYYRRKAMAIYFMERREILRILA
uniref:TLC domain-containing protein n=1 Tax=Panagrellus redivivus TaxID=6233 RepID=A0A7E4VQY7_PANRE